jgi:hypothetical protein
LKYDGDDDDDDDDGTRQQNECRKNSKTNYTPSASYPMGTMGSFPGGKAAGV